MRRMLGLGLGLGLVSPNPNLVIWTEPSNTLTHIGQPERSTGIIIYFIFHHLLIPRRGLVPTKIDSAHARFFVAASNSAFLVSTKTRRCTFPGCLLMGAPLPNRASYVLFVCLFVWVCYDEKKRYLLEVFIIYFIIYHILILITFTITL